MKCQKATNVAADRADCGKPSASMKAFILGFLQLDESFSLVVLLFAKI